MDRRVREYRRFHEGYGDILVQMNVEDTRNGVAEYVIEKLGVETIELKWGQGAKCIGGEIKVNDLNRAIELKKRGYIVTPDPEEPAFQAAFKAGPLKQFERHSRLGFIDQDGFMKEVERVRALGGTLRLDRPANGGCRVEVCLPLDAVDSAAATADQALCGSVRT